MDQQPSAAQQAPGFVAALPVQQRRTHAAASAIGRRRWVRVAARVPRASASVPPQPVAQSQNVDPHDANGAASKLAVPLDRVVCKFGGSSLADASRLVEVAALVKLQIAASKRAPIVVLSAMGPSTNELLAAGEAALSTGVVDISTVRARAYSACDELKLDKAELVDDLLDELRNTLRGVSMLKELSKRTRDKVVSFGERMSVRIFAAHLRKNEQLDAVHIDAFDMGFLTNSSFTNAELENSTFTSVRDYVDSKLGDSAIAIVTGFIAKDKNGNITTLGRGGSDLTASAIGAAIGASEVQVWKDVNGILSTDPRIVPTALPVPSVSFTEAAEMAYFGAKVLHPIAMMPAQRYDIPVRVKNSYNPEHPGTVILAGREVKTENPVTAVSLKKNVQLVDVCSTRMLGAYGFLAEVFKSFERHKISVDMIATSEVSISMTLNDSEVVDKVRDELVSELEAFATVGFSTGKAIVSLVSNASQGSQVVGRASMALHNAGIEVQMISQGASKFNISFVVDGSEAKHAVQVVHKEFFNC